MDERHCYAGLVGHGIGYVRTSTTRRSSPNRLENIDFAFGAGVLRDIDMRME